MRACSAIMKPQMGRRGRGLKDPGARSLPWAEHRSSCRSGNSVSLPSKETAKLYLSWSTRLETQVLFLLWPEASVGAVPHQNVIG